MENERRWINYDWFKLIVALILLVIFIILLLQPPSMAVAGGPLATSTFQATSLAQAGPATTDTSSPQATASPTVTASLTATALAATATTQPTATQAPSPTAQATVAATQAPTPTPEAATPTPAAQAASGDCSKALPTRLDVGKKALVVYTLYMRAQAGMDKPIIFTSLPGNQLDILGGPVCIPYNGGVYRWWNVKGTSGASGWSAEGSLLGNNYFMQPVP